MIVENAKQIHDMIAVRLFTFDNTPITKELSGIAMNWARSRKIALTVKDSKVLFILPEEMQGYLDWSQIEFKNNTFKDIFCESLDMIKDFGWTSVKRKIKRFTVKEELWLHKMAPEQYLWIVKS